MRKLLKAGVLTVALWAGAFAGAADASIIFTFTEEGGTVKMTPSGTLDTSKLVMSGLSDGWGGVGIENNGPGDIDIMGGTSFGAIDLLFGFNAGTDASAITNPGGPFTFSEFSPSVTGGGRPFSTYSGHLPAGGRQPGIGIRRIDLVGALWTPDQTWEWGAGDTFASLGLNPGTYTVADALTAESITIQIGPAAPEPTSLMLLGMGLAGLAARRRRTN